MTYSQTARVYGSAGNASLDQSGYSLGQSYLVNLFTFDFGSIPTGLHTLRSDLFVHIQLFNGSARQPEILWEPAKALGGVRDFNSSWTGLLASTLLTLTFSLG